MTKRNILIWLIILSALLTGAAGVHAAPADKNTEPQLLEYMGIVEETGDEDYLVTRSEFLKNVMMAFELPVSDIDTDPIYTDITKAHKYYKEIVSASEQGIVTGYNGQIRPDDPITKEEAMIITIKAMGAVAIPREFVDSLVEELDLYDGVTRGKTVSVSEMKRILYNALFTNSFNFYISNGKFTLNLNKNETFLNKIWNIYPIEGVVEAADGVSIYGESSDSAYIEISGSSLLKGTFSAGQLLGMNVKAFYEEKDTGNVLIWAYTTKDNRVSEYTYRDFASYTGQTFVFYDENSVERYNIGPRTTYILNGDLLEGSQISAQMTAAKREYRLIDNDRDNIYDIVIVNDPVVINPTASDAKNGVIVDQMAGEIRLEDYASYTISDIRGRAVSIESISKKSRLLLYTPASKEYPVKLIMLEDAQNGVIKSKSIRDDKETICLDDGTEYAVSAYSRLGYAEMEMNVEYTLYLDELGEVVDAEIMNRDSAEAIYLIKVKYIENTDTIEAKVMRQDGTISNITFAEKVMLRATDGTSKRHKQPSELYTALLNGDPKVKRQLVFAKFDENGNVNNIIQITNNTNEPYHFQNYERNVDNTENNAAQDLVPASTRRWWSLSCSFQNQIQLKQTTKVFVVPYDDAAVVDTNLMTITNVSSFRHEENYKMRDAYPNEGYVLRPVVANVGSIAADYMVIECPEGRTFSATQNANGIVTKFTKIWDDYNSEIVNRITILKSDGTLTEYDCDDQIALRAGKGDIVYIKQMGGKIRNDDFYIFYDADVNFDRTMENKVINIRSDFDKTDSSGNSISVTNPIGWRYYSSLRVTKGSVLNVDDNYAELNVLNKQKMLREFVDISSAKIIEFNIETGDFEMYDKGNLKKNDTFIGVYNNAKMMQFIKYVK